MKQGRRVIILSILMLGLMSGFSVADEKERRFATDR